MSETSKRDPDAFPFRRRDNSRPETVWYSFCLVSSKLIDPSKSFTNFFTIEICREVDQMKRRRLFYGRDGVRRPSLAGAAECDADDQLKFSKSPRRAGRAAEIVGENFLAVLVLFS
jgi:hypothetical protein